MALRIFITGASSGIGEALAAEYRRRHPEALIALVARRAEALAKVAQRIGGPHLCLVGDVADRASIAAAARRFLDEAGVPDIVIANAGISAGSRPGEPGDAQVFEDILRTNLIGLSDTFAPFLPAMRAAGRGHLVGIASVAGIRGLPGAGAYSASKAGAIAYLESLRVELRASGLRVVTIAPGFIRTPMTAGNRYRMPFLMPVEAFARAAVDAIAAGRPMAVIPWQMAWVARLLRWMPIGIFDRAFARAPRKAARSPR